MDRSYLSQPEVVAVSRRFVCIRLLTYEDSSENAFVKADGSGAYTAYGTVYYKNGDGIAVQREDHSIVTCRVPFGTNLDVFPVGTQVKIRCVRHDGSYRLAELQSGTDHIVLEP